MTVIVEDWNGSLGIEERALRQLERIGVFDVILGLVVGKPERVDQADTSIALAKLVLGVTRQYIGCGPLSGFTGAFGAVVRGNALRIRMMEN